MTAACADPLLRPTSPGRETSAWQSLWRTTESPDTLAQVRRLLLLALLLTVPSVALATSMKVPFAGNYATTITGKKPVALNGTWTIAIAPGGRYGIYKGGRKLVTGSVRTTLKRAVFIDQAGTSACPAEQAVGIYRWKRVRSLLTLTPISETCRGRRVVLSSRPLLKL